MQTQDELNRIKYGSAYAKAADEAKLEKSKMGLNVNENLAEYNVILEHMVGTYDFVKYLSKEVYQSSHLQIKDNCVFLDAIASSNFYMIPAWEKKYKKRERNGKIVEKVDKFNPSITCKHDFIHFVDWKKAYVYGNRLYLLASNRSLNTKSYRDMSYFSIAIECDMVDKMKIFDGHDFLDFRKIKFAREIDYVEKRDEDGVVMTNRYGDVLYEEVDRDTMFVENRYIEKSIPLKVLNNNELHLLSEYADEQFFKDREKYLSSVTQNTENKFANGQSYRSYGFYGINTSNQNVRDYEAADEEWNELNGAKYGLVKHNGRWVSKSLLESGIDIDWDNYLD